jgi:hypothetical protein
LPVAGRARSRRDGRAGLHPDAIDDRQRGEPPHGAVEIVEYSRRAMIHSEGTAHILTNVDVGVDGATGTATASSRVIAHHWSITDGWRITHRVVGVLGPGGLGAGTLPSVFAGFGGAS